MSQAKALARLTQANWLKAPGLAEVFAALDADAGRTRAVGGAVRDTLMGRAHTEPEVDLATEFTPEEVAVRAEANGIKAVPTGVDFGTVTLVAHGSAYEVTTLRKDIETDGRRAIVSFGTDWAEDAARRDFTLNALYCGPDGSLFDPLGGLEDCLSGRVRFIGDAATRIAEDRLRVFRFFRFSASHGGEIFDPDGLKACEAAAGDLGPVSAERIGHEMVRLLELDQVARTLRTMTGCGILGLDEPVLELLSGYEARSSAPDVAARLALMMGGTAADEMKSAWRLSNAVVGRAMRVKAAAEMLVAGQVDAVRYRYPDCALAALPVAAAIGSWTGERQGDIANALGQTVPDFPVSAKDLLAIGYVQGPALGTALAALEAEWIDSGFTRDRAALMRSADRHKP